MSSGRYRYLSCQVITPPFITIYQSSNIPADFFTLSSTSTPTPTFNLPCTSLSFNLLTGIALEKQHISNHTYPIFVIASVDKDPAVPINNLVILVITMDCPIGEALHDVEPVLVHRSVIVPLSLGKDHIVTIKLDQKMSYLVNRVAPILPPCLSMVHVIKIDSYMGQFPSHISPQKFDGNSISRPDATVSKYFNNTKQNLKLLCL